MTLQVDLIYRENHKGNFLLKNLTDIKYTDWEITLFCNNFNITHMTNVNFSYNNVTKIYTITPKAWKINIEPSSEIESDFLFSGIVERLDYEILNINFKAITKKENNNNKGISITIENNTDREIIIKPGEKYTFTI